MKIGDDVYRPGICWAMIPGNHKKSINDHLCGGPSVQYRVSKQGAITCLMWVCLTHKARMERQGYDFSNKL